MTNQQLITKMGVDMELRGMSEHTQRTYAGSIRRFLDFCENKNAELLNENDGRSYLIFLMRNEELSNASINTYNAAIRFFFEVTLNRTINYKQMPRFKKPKVLPDILNREETFQLINECTNLKHKSWFLLAYGSGLRASEIAALKVKDIDSESMRIFVRSGKGEKDRYTLLSYECLYTLREYWIAYRPNHSKEWLFPGTANSPNQITPKTIGKAFQKRCEILNITKDVSIHSLRHGFATHLLEDGASIQQIKDLLGHSSISSTLIYLHLANTTAGIVSPADRRRSDEN